MMGTGSYSMPSMINVFQRVSGRVSDSEREVYPQIGMLSVIFTGDCPQLFKIVHQGSFCLLCLYAGYFIVFCNAEQISLSIDFSTNRHFAHRELRVVSSDFLVEMEFLLKYL